MRLILLCVCTVLASTFAFPAVVRAAVVQNLRCEYLTNPLGIDRTSPRLSWIVSSTHRGDRQTAYQILVASTPGGLDHGHADLWDSGKVISGNESQVVYAGKPLDSRTVCYWKVRVWDADGKASAWSEPALWTMGLLHALDWQAQWVQAGPVKGTSETAASLVVRKAVYETADGAMQRDVTALVAAQFHDGSLSLKVTNDDMGGDLEYGVIKRLHVEYDLDGRTLEADVNEHDTLLLPPGANALPYLRKSFVLHSRARHATLYATALGLYEIHINGVRVGDHVFAPDWTDYRKRVRYQTYDVTSLLRPGANAIGALVGNGWYSGHIGNGGYQYYGTVPALMAQLEIDCADGTSQTVVTDGSWKEHAGPILSSDLMEGENYDATREIAGWDEPGLNEADWQPVTSLPQPLSPPGKGVQEALQVGELESQVMEPVRITQTLTPQALTEPAPGHWVFDLGQNMVGFARIRVDEPAGTTITLRHAEMLSPDGSIYTANLRGATATDTYVTRGGGVEVWQPRFTFHGFRYVELTGLTEKPTPATVTGIVIGSDIGRHDAFSCSDPRVNRLQENIEWGQRGNYLSVPTDCPQRDERMGWMGDAQVFIRTATHNADVAAFFTKWLEDVDDAQTPDGAYSDTSPSYGGGGTPGWADAGVICPWTIYLAYGDEDVLRHHLPNMTRWVEWCRLHSTNLIRDKDRNGDYGDWLSIDADTPKDLIGTAYFAYSTHLLAESYRAVGDTQNASKYDQLFEDIKTAFDNRFVTGDGHVQGETQCGYVMALKFNLLPDSLRDNAANYLAADIEAKRWHLSTGFLGVSYLLPVLTQAGKADIAYKLLLQDTFPSWLFSVKQGATTIWERWDGWTPDHGFQDPGMNSFNHYSLGSVGEWLYENVAGIAPDPTQPGYAHIIVHPEIRGPLTWAKGSYESILGTVATDWTRDGHNVTLNVTIPVGATATVTIPATDIDSVTESGRPIDQTAGVASIRSDGVNCVLDVASGSYVFRSTIQ
jgi:alpha-L-rhamnosidase